MIAVSINTRELERKLNAVSKALDSHRLLLDIGNDLTEGVIADQFKASHDPYGIAWKKLSFRQGQPLRDTGILQNSFMAKAEGNKVVVGTPVAYAPIHQKGMVITAKPNNSGTNSIGKRYGAKRLKFKEGSGFAYAKKVTIPARPILPDEQRGLPVVYQRCIEETVAVALNKAVNS